MGRLAKTHRKVGSTDHPTLSTAIIAVLASIVNDFHENLSTSADVRLKSLSASTLGRASEAVLNLIRPLEAAAFTARMF